jgi:hypothetical protein
MVIAKNAKTELNLNIKISGHNISRLNCTKILGVLVQSDLKWSDHLHCLKKKVNSANFAIYSIRNAISKEALLFVYYSYVYSFLTFGIMFWGTETKSLNEMFLLQKRSVRLICGLRARYSCRGYFKKLDFLTVPSLFIYTLCVFKFNNASLFEVNSDFHNYNTRNKNNVVLPPHLTNTLSRSPYYLSATLFDHLPSLLRK